MISINVFYHNRCFDAHFGIAAGGKGHDLY